MNDGKIDRETGIAKPQGDSKPADSRLCELLGGRKALLSLNYAESPIPHISSTVRAVIAQLIQGPGYGFWSQVSDLKVPADSRAIDIQRMLDDAGFLALYSPKFAEDSTLLTRVFSQADFRTPTSLEIGYPVELRRKKRFSFPALSITPLEDDLHLRFGHLVPDSVVRGDADSENPIIRECSAWQLARMTEPRLSKPALVTYFRRQN